MQQISSSAEFNLIFLYYPLDFLSACILFFLKSWIDTNLFDQHKMPQASKLCLESLDIPAIKITYNQIKTILEGCTYNFTGCNKDQHLFWK